MIGIATGSGVAGVLDELCKALLSRMLDELSQCPDLAEAAVRHAACVIWIAADSRVSRVLDARQRALPAREALRVANEGVRLHTICQCIRR